MKQMRVIALATIMVAPGQCAYSASSAHYFDTGIRYTSGDFGTTQTTSVKQLELSYGIVENTYDMSASLSYNQLSDGVNTESGLGDVILRGSNKLYDAGAYGDYMYGTLALKLPTADENKGLGTGEMDIGAFLNYTHRMDDVNLLLSAGYIVAGDSGSVTYNDVINYGIGVSKKLQSLFLYANLDGQQQVQATGDDPLELTVGGFYQLDTNHFIRANVLFGLSDGSPDNGFSIGFTNWF